MDKGIKDKYLTIRMSEDLREKLNYHAKKDGMRTADMVRGWCISYIQERERAENLPGSALARALDVAAEVGEAGGSPVALAERVAAVAREFGVEPGFLAAKFERAIEAFRRRGVMRVAESGGAVYLGDFRRFCQDVGDVVENPTAISGMMIENYEAVAGPGEGQDGGPAELVRFTTPVAALDPSTYLLIKVRGDSMAPFIMHGDIVMIKRGEAEPRNGDVVLVSHNGTGRLKRWYRRGEGRVTLHSDNTAVEDIETADNEVCVMGRFANLWRESRQ